MAGLFMVRNETNAVNRVLKKNSLNLIDGPHVKLLENKIAKLFGKKLCAYGKFRIICKFIRFSFT